MFDAGEPASSPFAPTRYRAGMHIVAAAFIDEINIREVPGPSTRIDLTGIQFSAVAPSPPPLVWAPHLVVIVRCGPDESPNGALEVSFLRDDEQIARNAQPLQVEPGRFSYRLVRAELDFPDYGSVEAHCSVDRGPVTVVPYTLLPPPGT